MANTNAEITTNNGTKTTAKGKSKQKLSAFINAERFVPKRKQDQWDQIPQFLLIVSPRSSYSSTLNSWIHDPIQKRSNFDLSFINTLFYLNYYLQSPLNGSGETQRIRSKVLSEKLEPDIKVVTDVLRKNSTMVENLRLKIDNSLKKKEITKNTTTASSNTSTVSGNPEIFDDDVITKTAAETVAKLCDEMNSLHHDPIKDATKIHNVFNRYRFTIRDYVTRMRMLIDVERTKSMEDMKAYDMYSRKFEYIEIPPPAHPKSSCPVCTFNSKLTNSKRGQRRLCGYHKAISCHSRCDSSFEQIKYLERGASKINGTIPKNAEVKPSIISSQAQFDALPDIFNDLSMDVTDNDKIIAYIHIPGVAENRPLVSLGSELRFRFDFETECIGEVVEVAIRSEIVMVLLPSPNLSTNHVAHMDPFRNALIHPSNRQSDSKDRSNRFDLRFGLFASRGYDVFHQVLQEALQDLSIETSQLLRVVGPTPFLGDITTKAARRLQIGISEWVTSVNLEQKQAVFDIVRCNQGSAPYIIYGPPGTGKTTTLIESIVQVLRCNSDSKILVCAPSDAACDVIAKRLLPLLPKIESNDGDGDGVSSMKQHKMMRINWWSRNPSSLPPELLACSPSNLSGFYEIPTVEEMKEVSVIICQCFVSGCLEIGDISNRGWMANHFTHMFSDECSQSFECEALTPILKVGRSCSIILAGDPKQLGPTVRSTTASRGGLCLSLQERLMGLPLYNKDSEYCVMTTLLNNYRSHDALLQIPSELFYGGSLRCEASSEITTLCKDFELLPDGDFPLMVYDVSKGQERSKLDTPSFYNLEECHAVVDLITALLSSESVHIHTGQIAVITCFRAQVLKLREILRIKNLGAVNVGLVEDFQGQETAVTLISTVLTKKHERWTSGAKGGLGFMTDPKRFNVALTRASALCIIVGHVSFLGSNGTYWTALIEHVRYNYGISGDSINDGYEEANNDDENHGISQFLRRVEELDLCLGAGHEEDRYELAMRGYFQDAPEWKVCL